MALEIIRRATATAVAIALSWGAGATTRAACPGAAEQVVAYSVATDRYAIRVDATTSPARRFVVKRLSTDEPLDDVACAGDERCDLTDVLGMRACGFTRVYSSKGTLALSLQEEADGRGTWKLMLAHADGAVPVLTFRARGTLELGAARVVGGRVLLTLREKGAGECPEIRVRVLEVDAAVLRASPARATERGRVDVDLTVDADFTAPVPRVAPTFPTMPVRHILKAAEAAVASGMLSLAECWIRHGATVMSADDREAMRHALADNPYLSTFSHLATKRAPVASTPKVAVAEAPRASRPKTRAARRRRPAVMVIIDVAPPHPLTSP